MFSEIIRETPFTTKAANAYFADKIAGDSWNGDTTLLSTLRALLADRIGENSLYVKYFNWGLGSKLHNYDEQRLLEMARERFDAGPNTFSVCTVSSGDRGSDAEYYGILEKGFADGSWVKLPIVTEFFRKNFEVICFVNEEEKKTLFLLKEFNSRICHILQLASLTVLPWYFNPNGGDVVSEQELALLNSLTEKSSTAYMAKLNELVKAFDFRTAYITSIVGGIESAYEKSRIDRIRNAISDKREEIRAWRGRISEVLMSIASWNIELFGLETKIKEDGDKSIICDYFIANKRMVIDNVSNNTTITFHVNDYLQYFDEEMAEHCIANRRSFVYSFAPDKDVAEKIARAIFLDGTIKLRFCAGYSLDVRGSFNAISGFDFGLDGQDRFPNTHIDEYHCLGNYEEVILDKLEKRDLIGVLEQACASARSLSFGDTIVMEKFFRKLYSGTGGKCFELPDGRQMDINEVIKYVTEEQEAANE